MKKVCLEAGQRTASSPRRSFLETSKKAEERREEALKADIEAKRWTAKAEEARYLREMVQLETEKVRLEKEKIERDIALMKYNDLLRLQQTETKK